jgi:hypothetical protein
MLAAHRGLGPGARPAGCRQAIAQVIDVIFGHADGEVCDVREAGPPQRVTAGRPLVQAANPVGVIAGTTTSASSCTVSSSRPLIWHRKNWIPASDSA